MRIKVKRTYILTAIIVIVMVSIFSQIAKRAFAVENISSINAAVLKNNELIKSGKGSMHELLKFAADKNSKLSVEMKIDYQVAFKGRCFLMTKKETPIPEGNHTPRKTTVAFNGKSTMLYDHNRNELRRGDEKSPVGREAISLFNQICGFRELVDNNDKKPKVERKILKHEKVDGKDCVVIKDIINGGFQGVKYTQETQEWRCPAEKYRLLKAITWVTFGSIAKREIASESYIDYKNTGGVWVPTNINTFTYGIDKASGSRYKASQRIIEFAPDFKFNTMITDKDLLFTPPKDVKIYDDTK